MEVNGEQFAIDLHDAKEIVLAGQIRKLPQSLDYIDGIFNYRGEIVHVLNLNKKLKLDEHKKVKIKESADSNDENIKQHIIIVTVNGINVGFLVDRIINVVHVSVNDIVGLNPIIRTSADARYIRGIVKFKDNPRIWLDLKKILTEAEQNSMQDDLIHQL